MDRFRNWKLETGQIRRFIYSNKKIDSLAQTWLIGLTDWSEHIALYRLNRLIQARRASRSRPGLGTGRAGQILTKFRVLSFNKWLSFKHNVESANHL